MNRLLATILSSVCHPLLVPGYLFYVVCYQLPGVVLRPALPDRWLVLGVVLLFTFLLPSLGTALLLWGGYVSSLELRERRQRPLPLLLAVIGFGTAALLMGRYPQAFDGLLVQMMAGMTLAVLLTLLISLRWKISAHGVGMGGTVGLLALLFLGGEAGSTIIWWLMGSIVLAGAVMSARLALNAHTPEQVWAGFGLGASLVMGFGVGLALG